MAMVEQSNHLFYLSSIWSVHLQHRTATRPRAPRTIPRKSIAVRPHSTPPLCCSTSSGAVTASRAQHRQTPEETRQSVGHARLLRGQGHQDLPRPPRRPRLHHLRLHHVQAQARLPHRLRVLQARRRAQGIHLSAQQCHFISFHLHASTYTCPSVF